MAARLKRNIENGRVGVGLGLLAIFIALGGFSEAAKLINGKTLKKASVAGNRLKANTLTGGQVRDGSLESVDLAPGAAQAPTGSITSDAIADGAIAAVDLADGSVTTPKLANNAIVNGKIADNAVTDGKIADNAVTATELATNSVDEPEIAPNAVRGSEVQTGAIGGSDIADNSLSAHDAASRSGVIRADFGTISAFSCVGLRLELDLDGGSGSYGLTNDPTIVTPGDEFQGSVVTSVESAGSGDTIIKGCNPTNTAVDPDDSPGDVTPGANYYWAIFTDNNP